MKVIFIVIPVIIAVILGGFYLISASSNPEIQPSELSPELSSELSPEQEQSSNTQKELLSFQNKGLKLRNNEDCVAFYSTGSTQYCVLEPSKYPDQCPKGSLPLNTGGCHDNRLRLNDNTFLVAGVPQRIIDAMPEPFCDGNAIVITSIAEKFGETRLTRSCMLNVNDYVQTQCPLGLEPRDNGKWIDQLCLK